jgi:hypothetical protein
MRERTAEGTVGVRNTLPLMRSAAASTSLNVSTQLPPRKKHVLFLNKKEPKKLYFLSLATQ